jgi:hypothetical protein
MSSSTSTEEDTMCYQCERDGDHGQPCPEHEAWLEELAEFDRAAALGEEALEAYYFAPKANPLNRPWPEVVAADADIPF